MHLSEEASRPKYKFSNIPEIENLSTGPIQSFRGCTDPLCYILFLIITVYFIGVSSVALFLGEVDLIGAPYDPNHRACGVDSEAIDYPYIYFVTPSSDSSGNYLYRTVCLKECPSNIGSNVYATTLDCLTNNVVTTCSFKAHPANESVLYYNTVPYLGKVCLPEATVYFESVEDYIDAGWVTNVIVDVKHSFFMITAGLTFTLVLALFLMKTLRWCDKFMIRTLMAVYFAIFMLFGIGFIYKGFSTSEIDSSLMFQDTEQLLDSASVSTSGLLAYIIIGSLLILFALATSIYICLHQDYTKIMSGLIQTTFEFLSDNNILILFSVLLYIVLSFIIMCSIALALFIYSVGFVDDTLDYTQYYPFNQFQNTPFFYYNLWGLLVFMVWCGYIFLGVYQFVLMGTASHWYFRDTHIDAESRRKGIKRKPEEITYSSKNVVRNYVQMGLTKHFGSIVLGSFMILLFGWLNTIMTFIKEKLELTYRRTMNQKHCFNPFFHCIEWLFKCVRYNTETAYIMVAYRGEPFINSGLLTSHIIDEYYEIFSELSTLTTSLAVGLNLICCLIPSVIFYYVFEYIPWYTTYLSSSLHPALVIGLLSLINVSIFNTLFSNIVDSLIICYCIDKENLKFTRKFLHFNKDPEYQSIPKEPFLENKYFLNKLLESFHEKFKRTPTTELSQLDLTVKNQPAEAPRKNKPKKTCIMKPEKTAADRAGLENINNNYNNYYNNNDNNNGNINNGSQFNNNNPFNNNFNMMSNPNQMRGQQMNRFVEQYSLPKVNDIIRGSSPIKNAWISEEKQPPAASKKRLEQQRSPFKEAPFSEVIKNSNDGFNFQKEAALNVLRFDLKLDENP